MIYLCCYTPESIEIAAVEEAGHAQRYEAQGYTRCTPGVFRAAWRLRDARAVEELRTTIAMERARAVGETAPIKGPEAGPVVEAPGAAGVRMTAIGKLFKH